MAVRSLVALTVTRPGGSAISVAGLRSGALAYEAEAVGAGGVLSSGTVYATSAPGLYGWSISFEALGTAGSASRAALRGAQRGTGSGPEPVAVACTLGDGRTYTGTAYVASFARAGSVGSAAAYACTLAGTGALTAASASGGALLPYGLFALGADGAAVHLYGYDAVAGTWDDLGGTSVPSGTVSFAIDRAAGLLFYAHTTAGVFSETLGDDLAPAGVVATTFATGSVQSTVALDYDTGEVVYQDSLATVYRSPYDGSAAAATGVSNVTALWAEGGRTYFKAQSAGVGSPVGQYDVGVVEGGVEALLYNTSGSDSSSYGAGFYPAEGAEGTYVTLFSSQILRAPADGSGGSLAGTVTGTRCAVDPDGDRIFVIASGSVAQTDFAGSTPTTHSSPAFTPLDLCWAAPGTGYAG